MANEIPLRTDAPGSPEAPASGSLRPASRIPAIAAAILAPLCVLFLLGVSRIFVSRAPAPDLTLREIGVASDPAPPPPPPPPSAVEPPPPSPPAPLALTDVDPLPDLSRIAVAKGEVPMDAKLSVDVFSLDVAPPPLPGAQVSRRPAVRRRPPAPPRRETAPKSVYSIGELDGRPRLLSHPSVSFPEALSRRGVRRGTVVLEVEIDRRGSVRVRRVVSSTHPELVPKARRIAAGSKFTPPLRHGRPVRAVMRWPIVIRR